jgi:uncharacterized membrane protein YeaQ/YmgE (transglycosylase-associated protein family)
MADASVGTSVCEPPQASMETLLWIVIGGLAGAVAAFAFPGFSGMGPLGSVAIGSIAALVGAFVVDAIVGDVARVRVAIITSDAFGAVVFGLAPALAAGVAAVATLASIERVKRRA